MASDYIKREEIEQKMYHEAFENDASYDERNPMAKWDSGLWIRYKLFENVLADIPSADVVERKRGKWIWDKDGVDWNIGAWCCSECGSRNANIGCNGNENPMWWSGSRFCPNCGADMRERESE